MSFIIVVLCLALLIVLISYFKVDAFIAFLISSILAGIALGIPLEKLPDSVNNGIGSILGGLISAVIRLCVGSATVAALTAAGVVMPLVTQTGANPNLMVLSLGAGSLMFSHVNDSGFWMFKEYFNLSIKDTICSWSIMETIVSVVGLIGVMILNMIV